MNRQTANAHPVTVQFAGLLESGLDLQLLQRCLLPPTLHLAAWRGTMSKTNPIYVAAAFLHTFFYIVMFEMYIIFALKCSRERGTTNTHVNKIVFLNVLFHGIKKNLYFT